MPPLDIDPRMLGQRIAEARKARGKTQEEVAEFLGDPPPPRRLPGTGNIHQHAKAMVGAVEGNWLIKLLLLAGAAIGLVLSVMQLGGMLN